MENHLNILIHQTVWTQARDAGRLSINGDSFPYPQGLARLLVLGVGRGMGHLGARASTGRP